MKNRSLEEEFDSLERLYKVKKNIMDGYASVDDVKFLESELESGTPCVEFIYGLYLLMVEEKEEDAIVWFNKAKKHANGLYLWYMSGVFANLGDVWVDWSMACLRRGAWRQFPIAKRMLKSMKKTPFKLPEA